MSNKKIRIIRGLLIVPGLILVALSYPSLPERIPTSWGFDGTVSYSPKIQIWLIDALMPLFTILLDAMPRIDPRKNHYQKFSRYYDGFCILFEIFWLLILIIILSESFYPGRLSVGRIVTALLGILLMWVGNIIPKLKSNFYMGIKTPWTLSDEEIWHRTHRLGGKTMFTAGAALLILGRFLTTKWGAAAAMLIILLASFTPGLMSYIWWKKKQGGNLL